MFSECRTISQLAGCEIIQVGILLSNPYLLLNKWSLTQPFVLSLVLKTPYSLSKAFCSSHLVSNPCLKEASLK